MESISMEEQLPADGVAQRSAVVTPVPAFGSSVYRFPDLEDGIAISPTESNRLPSSQFAVSSLAYSHVRQVKGWASADDFVKPRGQATSAKATSYMALPSTPPLPSSSLLDLVLRSTNEMRLQELYELYNRRKLIGPGPGEHDAKSSKGKQSHRRPHLPDRDGPNVLEAGHASTRSKEMEQLQSCHYRGSGLGPGHYDGSKGKDSCLRNGKTGGRIGSSVRGDTKGLLAYAPSMSYIISQQQDADQGEGIHRMGGPRKQTHGLADPEQVGMFRPATAVGNYSQGTAPTVITCIPYSCSQAAPAGTCGFEQPATPQDVSQGEKAVASRENLYLTGKQQQSRNSPKQPPCPRQLLVSASHCELPGDWDWRSLNRSAWRSFSAQAGGCHRNSRTTSQCKIGVLRRPAQVAWSWEGPVETAKEMDDGEHGRSTTSMEPIPEEEIAVAPPCTERIKRHKLMADCSALVSDSEIRSHELAHSHAEQARAVDIRRRQWELYSGMYSTVLPLLKKQIAMDRYYKPME